MSYQINDPIFKERNREWNVIKITPNTTLARFEMSNGWKADFDFSTYHQWAVENGEVFVTVTWIGHWNDSFGQKSIPEN